MKRFRLLRVVAAGLLAASAFAFAVGSSLERAGHRETAAEPTRRIAVPTPTPARAAAPTSTRRLPTSAAPRVVAAPAVTKDPRLTAPEGSAQRETGERAARAAKASPRPAPRSTATGASLPAVTASAAGVVTQAPEGSAAREAAEHAGAGAASQTVPGEASERLFGVNPESTGLVVVTVGVTALLALLVLLVPVRRGLPWVAAAAAVFCAAAVALDVREVAHQYAVGTTRVLVAAAIVAMLHALACIAMTALSGFARGRTRTGQPVG